jgi:hypothetical protein
MQDISAIPNMPTTSNMQMTAPAANSKMPPETATMTTPVSTSQAAQRAALNMNKQATTPAAMVYEAQQPGRPFAPENAKTGAGTSSIKAPISGGSIMDENRNLMGLNKNSKSTGSLGDYFKSRDNRSK